MSSLSTLPKGDSAWLLRKSIQRIMQQVSVLETNIGSSTTGNSANTQVIFNDAGTLRGDAGLTYNAATDTLSAGSATITGDLTVNTNVLKVDSTNDRVGILTATPTAPLDILANALADALLIRGNDNANTKIRMVNSGASGEEFSLSVGYPGASNSSFVLRSITAGINRYIADQTGAHFWATNAGTAMTLNSTGLGLGTAVQYARLTSSGSNSTGIANIQNSPFASNANTNLSCYIGHDGTANRPFIQAATGNAGNAFDLLIQPYGGNVGIGVTPSAWATTYKAIQIGSTGCYNYRNFTNAVGNNYYNNGTNDVKIVSGYALKYEQNASDASHSWWNSTLGVGTVAFTQAMTLDASGNLLVGTTGASSLIGGSGAITAKGLAGTLSVNVTALATDYTLPIGAFSGIITIRSNGGGGSAVFMLDPNVGAVSIANNIVGRTITLTYSGGAWKLQQTAGTVPSTYNYLVLSTQ